MLYENVFRDLFYKTFSAVNNSILQETRAFATVNHLNLSLIFTSEAGAYPHGAASLWDSTLSDGLKY
jgi:hypothetical protein